MANLYNTIHLLKNHLLVFHIIYSILLTILGQKLNVDIYLAAIVVFVGRMFVNLAIIRRYYVDKWSKAFENKHKNGKTVEAEEKEEMQ